MRRETQQSLLDASAAAQEIIALAADDWRSDRPRALAIERLMMIVGEAFVRIRSSEPELLDRIEDAHKVIGMRNVLVHGYDALDPGRIEDAIEHSLPKLIEQLDELLN